MTFQPDMLYLDAGGSLGPGSVVACTSWGNDSIALVQWLRESGAQDVVCLYNDTGWSWPEANGEEAWLDRVTRMEAWAVSIGFRVARTASIGMEALVLSPRGNGWPRQGMQFCTEVLKIGPTQKWLAKEDPHGAAICMNGKRRAESQQRSTTIEWIQGSMAHGGRDLRQPLYDHSTEERDALVRRAGHEVLPHKSRECICVNSNASDLQTWPQTVIARVDGVELAAGFSALGKPKTMFRPASKMGATGIHEVIRWSKAGRGKYRPLDDGTGPTASETGCDGGFCAT